MVKSFTNNIEEKMQVMAFMSQYHNPESIIVT